MLRFERLDDESVGAAAGDSPVTGKIGSVTWRPFPAYSGRLGGEDLVGGEEEEAEEEEGLAVGKEDEEEEEDKALAFEFDVTLNVASDETEEVLTAEL